MQRTQGTYPLSHFRQNPGEHLERLAEGHVETITQNGEAAMVVMSPEIYNAMRIELERGQLWDQAIDRFDRGERGVDAREAMDQVAARLTSER